MKGKVLPAEWQRQAALLLGCPYHDWQDKLQATESVFSAVITRATAAQKVILICQDEATKTKLQNRFSAVGDNLKIYVCKSNDCWARDYAPITIYNEGNIQLLDFEFNGWGEKFPSNLDNKINQHLHQSNAFKDNLFTQVNFIMEGGSIDTDGQGTLLTTTSYWTARHPDLTLKEIENKLTSFLGSEQFLWLHHGYLSGDHTNGHVDLLARFVSADAIAYSACSDSTHPSYNALKQMENELSTFCRPGGKNYQLVPLYIPAGNTNIPYSYTNFLITNEYVFIPIYNKPEDQDAIDKLKNCFPQRKIHTIDCSILIQQGGALHCIAMPLPEKINDAYN